MQLFYIAAGFNHRDTDIERSDLYGFLHENYIRHWRLFFPLYSDEQLTEKRLGD